MFQRERLFLRFGEVLRLLSGRFGRRWHHVARQRQRGNADPNVREAAFVLVWSQTNCYFRQVYMWVGSQTSQVEIKLSLKACQVSLVLLWSDAQQEAPVLRPYPQSCLSSVGLHPAHALQRHRAPQKTAAGPKGKRAPLLHTMLPRLGCFQNTPLINQLARKKMLPCVPWCPPCLIRALISPQLSPLPKHAETELAWISCRIKVGKQMCTDVLYRRKLNSRHIKGFCCSPLSGLQGALEDQTAARLKRFRANKSLIFCFSIMRDWTEKPTVIFVWRMSF